MEYFFYGRDREGPGSLRTETLEAHWSFMDAYADGMIARGPTLSSHEDGVMTGSVHIVDLPDAAAAHVFAYEEPFFKADVFEDVLVRRWSNALGRTMWQFAGTGALRFLVIGHGAAEAAVRRGQLRDRQAKYFAGSGLCEVLIACGPLLANDGSRWLGSAMMAEASDKNAVREMIAQSPYGQDGLYAHVEVHPWRFGGRPASQ